MKTKKFRKNYTTRRKKSTRIRKKSRILRNKTKKFRRKKPYNRSNHKMRKKRKIGGRNWLFRTGSPAPAACNAVQGDEQTFSVLAGAGLTLDVDKLKPKNFYTHKTEKTYESIVPPIQLRTESEIGVLLAGFHPSSFLADLLDKIGDSFSQEKLGMILDKIFSESQHFAYAAQYNDVKVDPSLEPLKDKLITTLSEKWPSFNQFYNNNIYSIRFCRPEYKDRETTIELTVINAFKGVVKDAKKGIRIYIGDKVEDTGTERFYDKGQFIDITEWDWRSEWNKPAKDRAMLHERDDADDMTIYSTIENKLAELIVDQLNDQRVYLFARRDIVTAFENYGTKVVELIRNPQ